jgi:hypothetical protein
MTHRVPNFVLLKNVQTFKRKLLELQQFTPRGSDSLANDMKSFKTYLKRFLYHHSFYSVEEYYEYNDDKGV